MSSHSSHAMAVISLYPKWPRATWPSAFWMKSSGCVPCFKPRAAEIQTSDSMAGRIPESLQKKLTERLTIYEDLGIGLFYRDRHATQVLQNQELLRPPENMARPDELVPKEPALP